MFLISDTDLTPINNDIVTDIVTMSALVYSYLHFEYVVVIKVYNFFASSINIMIFTYGLSSKPKLDKFPNILICVKSSFFTSLLNYTIFSTFVYSASLLMKFCVCYCFALLRMFFVFVIRRCFVRCLRR